MMSFPDKKMEQIQIYSATTNIQMQWIISSHLTI